MKIGDKVYCIKDNSYNGYCHKKNHTYVIESFLDISGKGKYISIPTEHIKSVYITAEPNTTPKDVLGYSINPMYTHDKFEEYFIDVKEVRKLKLKKINENWR
jgi:hypothetical protein